MICPGSKKTGLQPRPVLDERLALALEDPRRLDPLLERARQLLRHAHVRVQDAYLPRFFTDDLTFVRSVGQDWRIVSKVWHYEVLDEKPTGG